MITGFDFKMTGPGQIKDVDKAKALISRLLAPKTQISIKSLEYEYLYSNGKPYHAQATNIEGMVWLDSRDEE